MALIDGGIPDGRGFVATANDADPGQGVAAGEMTRGELSSLIELEIRRMRAVSHAI